MIAKTYILAQFWHRGTPLLFGDPGESLLHRQEFSAFRHSVPEPLAQSNIKPLHRKTIGTIARADNFVAANTEGKPGLRSCVVRLNRPDRARPRATRGNVDIRHLGRDVLKY